MSEKIVQLNEEVIKGQIKELVRGSVEETLNELLEKEAESLTQAARYPIRTSDVLHHTSGTGAEIPILDSGQRVRITKLVAKLAQSELH